MAQENKAEAEDYYAVLGVDKEADQKTIKKAYRHNISLSISDQITENILIHTLHNA